MDTTVEIIFLKELERLRKHLHIHPELSGKEKYTAAHLARFLKKYHPDELHTAVGGHGLLAVYDSGSAGPVILFRAELDGLPINETNSFKYRSVKKGVAHKCGHDGHLAVLTGLAGRLSFNPISKGKVLLLFQPAEEDGSGAEAVLNDEVFRSFEPDYVFAMHNLPGYPKNEIVIKHNVFTAAVKSLAIRLKGRTAHAGEPEHGINPGAAIAEILNKSLKLSRNQPIRKDFTIVTPIHIKMGELAYGTSAGDGELHLTIRAWTDNKLETLSKNIEKIILKAADKYGVEAEVKHTHFFHANRNCDEAIDWVKKAAEENKYPVAVMNHPFKWGEDFGLFTQRFSGAMFGIGAGVHCPALQNPDYDYPDDLLFPSINMFHSIVRLILS